MCVKLAALFVLTVASVSTLSDAASLDHLSAQLQAYLPTGTFLTYTVLAQLTTSSLDISTAGCCSKAANYKEITDTDPCRTLWNKTTNQTHFMETYSQICTADNVCGTGFKLTAVLTAVTGLVCFVVALTGTNMDTSWIQQSAKDAKHSGTQKLEHGLNLVPTVVSDQSASAGLGRPATDLTPEKLADSDSRTRPGETLEGPGVPSDTSSAYATASGGSSDVSGSESRKMLPTNNDIRIWIWIQPTTKDALASHNSEAAPPADVAVSPIHPTCKHSCKYCGQRDSAIEKILPKWFYQGCPECAGACPHCGRRSTNYPFQDWARAIGNTVIFLVLALLTPPVSTCFFPGLDTVYVQAVPVVVSFGLSGLLTAWHACQDRKRAAMEKHRTAYLQKFNASN